jgi:hypothetical protein
MQSLHIAKYASTFHFACSPIDVIAVFRSAGIASRLEPVEIPMACVDIEVCRCLLDPAEIQSGPDPISETEEEETEAPSRSSFSSLMQRHSWKISNKFPNSSVN